MTNVLLIQPICNSVIHQRHSRYPDGTWAKLSHAWEWQQGTN